VLTELMGSTSPTSQPRQCAVFRRICISLPRHTRFPEMLLKKSHLAQTNDPKKLTPYPATDLFPEPVPTCGPKNIFTIFFLWRNSPYLATAPPPHYRGSDKPHSVELLWTSDQPDAQNSTWQNTTITRDRHPCTRLDLNLQSQHESGPRPSS